jgi:hypothetical protein
MMKTGARAGLAFGMIVSLALAACGPGAGVRGRPGGPGARVESRQDAYLRLQNRLETFRVSGGVRTSGGLLLPERIAIEIRSEVCVESRQPGTRFWSLDYDTCFSYVDIDTVDEKGEYSVSVPCLDADQSYESRHHFGDLRLVQNGPVSFLAESDAGWRHQETFASSRFERRDIELTLDTDTFYVVRPDAPFVERPEPDATVIRQYGFGTPVEVIRFHRGWAQLLMGDRIGWMEIQYLGTEAEKKEREPFHGKTEARPLPEPLLEFPVAP